MPPVLEKGDEVKQDSILGIVGSSGLSSGPHVDFRITIDGKSVDPSTILTRPGSIKLDAESVSEDNSKRITNIME